MARSAGLTVPQLLWKPPAGARAGRLGFPPPGKRRCRKQEILLPATN